MSTILFQNCRLFDSLEGRLLDDRHVLVEGERIKEVADAPIKAAEAQVVDLRGRTLLPGLIDAHFHALAADPDFARLEQMPRSLLHQHARVLLEAALKRGFTTVRDAGGADYGLAMAIKAGLIEGPRLFFSGRALTQTGGHADFRSREAGHSPGFGGVCLCGQGSNVFGTIADGVPAVRQAAREELRKGATQIKIMASGGVSSPSDPIWNLQYSEEEIRAIVWEARSWRTYVMAHAYTAEAIARCVDFGVRSIEHANLIDAPTARRCAEAGAFVVPTLVTYDALEITRALVTSPKLLLLDEPLAGIDPIAQYEVSKITKRLKDRGLGVLITDHSVREMLKLIDRGYIIHKGEVLVQGTAEFLANDPKAREIYLGPEFNM